MADIAVRIDHVDDSWWEEVRLINPYALFMGYLSMAIRGLGFLAITWTTVVLLGGFVSTLGNKDFWCLTMISLLQTAGVYDVFLNEKLRYITQSATVFSGVPLYELREYFSHGSTRSLGSFFLSRGRLFLSLGRFIPKNFPGAVQALVLGIVLCPLMALYMFGLLISTGISLWRLIEHDFGDGEAHLKPALQVLYFIAVLQGSLFIYRFIFSLKEEGLVKDVAQRYKFGRDRDGAKLFWDYSRKLRIGCGKDPTFASGRNLITFAVDLIKSESPAEYISGVTILDGIACEMGSYTDTDRGHLMLMKQLIGTTSSCTILQKLVQTLHEGSPYDVDTRIRAASIVEHFADHFYLEQFPRGTQCIISLLSQPYSRVNAEQGQLILWKLAANEDNCRVMSTTHGLVSNIMAPVSLQDLHKDFHDQWSNIAYISLILLARLMKNSPGEAGESLRREIASNNAVISTIETAFTCGRCECDPILLKIAVETLLYMPVDTSYVLPPANKGRFMKIVANMIVDDSEEDSLRTIACENLTGLCIQCTENGEFLKQLVEALTEVMPKELVVATLHTSYVLPPATKGKFMKIVEMIVNDRRQNSLRTMACENLEEMRIQCTKNREFLQQLVEALTEVMPKILKEIVPPYGSAGDVMQTSTEGFSAPGTDVEKSHVSRDDEQRVYKKLSSQPYYLSLCVAICDTLINAYPHLARRFNELAADIRPGEFKSFACLVNKSQQFVDEKKKKSGGHSTIVSKGDYRIGGQLEIKVDPVS